MVKEKFCECTKSILCCLVFLMVSFSDPVIIYYYVIISIYLFWIHHLHRILDIGFYLDGNNTALTLYVA